VKGRLQGNGQLLDFGGLGRVICLQPCPQVVQVLRQLVRSPELHPLVCKVGILVSREGLRRHHQILVSLVRPQVDRQGVRVGDRPNDPADQQPANQQSHEEDSKEWQIPGTGLRRQQVHILPL
jgi:hypothetical protein